MLRLDRLARPCSLLLLAAFLAAGCDGDDPATAPTTGALRVDATTTGEDIDSDGYSAVLDNAETRTIPTTGTTTFPEIETGEHDLELAGLATNCGVTGPNPRTVSVTAGDTTVSLFDVSCFGLLQDQIVFQSDRSGATELYVMNPDGSGLEQLTLDGGENPMVSPDGARIVFQRGNSVWVMNADGSGAERLTDDAFLDRTPYWSPDGTQIAFSSFRSDDLEQLFAMGADGTDILRLRTDTVPNNNPAWSPDGTRIAYTRFQGGGSSLQDIYVLELDGTGNTNLTGDPHLYSRPEWSPDGSRLAFSRFQVYVMNVDGTGEIQLTTSARFNGAPVWSPDGSRLAYVHVDTLDNRDIWVMNADGSGKMSLTDGPALDGHPWWAR